MPSRQFVVVVKLTVISILLVCTCEVRFRWFGIRRDNDDGGGEDDDDDNNRNRKTPKKGKQSQSE